ncbi:MAG: lactate racemase domain-containing protein, partial [Candidatus Bathyarchaeia archaeon]
MVKIPYGEGHLEAELPAGNRVSVFRPSPPRDPIGMGSIERTIRKAVLRNRASIRASKGRICLLVSDNTRAAFNRVIVPRLLGSIGELVDTSELKILVANGL